MVPCPARYHRGFNIICLYLFPIVYLVGDLAHLRPMTCFCPYLAFDRSLDNVHRGTWSLINGIIILTHESTLAFRLAGNTSALFTPRPTKRSCTIQIWYARKDKDWNSFQPEGLRKTSIPNQSFIDIGQKFHINIFNIWPAGQFLQTLHEYGRNSPPRPLSPGRVALSVDTVVEIDSQNSRTFFYRSFPPRWPETIKQASVCHYIFL